MGIVKLVFFFLLSFFQTNSRISQSNGSEPKPPSVPDEMLVVGVTNIRGGKRSSCLVICPVQGAWRGVTGLLCS